MDSLKWHLCKLAPKKYGDKVAAELSGPYFPIRDTKYVDRLIDSMRLGGLLAFRYGVLKKGADRSGSAASLGIPEEGELKEIFRNLRILQYQEVEEISDWQVGNS